MLTLQITDSPMQYRWERPHNVMACTTAQQRQAPQPTQPDGHNITALPALWTWARMPALAPGSEEETPELVVIPEGGKTEVQRLILLCPSPDSSERGQVTSGDSGYYVWSAARMSLPVH